MYTSAVLPVVALFSLVQGHGVVLSAKGDTGEAVGFRVEPNIPRNCTGINPCQLDTTIIRDAEIKNNVVNGCGRTELAGNIDIGLETENEIVKGRITTVKKGSSVNVVIHQVNADGAGPYVCDVDETSNAGTFRNVTVENNIPGVNGFSQIATTQFTIKVNLPQDLNCIGASTGNFCTVRCRNNAVAGPFGGCFAVQQSDVTPKINTPQNIATAATLKAFSDQTIATNKQLSDAMVANANVGLQANVDQQAAVDKLVGLEVATKAFPVQTPKVDLTNAKAAAPPAATPTPAPAAPAAGNADKGKKGNKGNKNNKRRDALRWAKRTDAEEEDSA